VRVLSFYRWLGQPVKIPMPTVPNPLPETYSEAELTAIMTHPHGDRLLFKTLLQSGLRANEAAHLRRANLLDRGIQVAPYKDWSPNNSEERVITVPAALITELQLNPDDCWLHRFRANIATTLLRAGVDVRTVAAQLGHRSLAPTLRYLALLGYAALQAKGESVWK
jgi:integrase